MFKAALVAVAISVSLNARAVWVCTATCHYYLPNSSRSHPSLPDQAHETVLKIQGYNRDLLYERLIVACRQLGFEGQLLGNRDSNCSKKTATDKK